MGRYDFRPLQIHKNASRLIEIGGRYRPQKRQPWLDAFHSIPPAEPLVRPVLRTASDRGKRKPSKMFQPVELKYPEDELRVEFYKDHPWELARPRVVLENDGRDAESWDWSRMQQPGKRLDGESVVQRQLWLMSNAEMTKQAAYDKARREFYHYRHREQIAQRVAKEEALSYGSYFGKGALEVGMQLEDQAFEDWKEWATTEVTTLQQAAASSYSGPMEDDEGGVSSTADQRMLEAVETLGSDPVEKGAAAR